MKRTTYKRMLLGRPARITVEKTDGGWRMQVCPVDREVLYEAAKGQNPCNGSRSPVYSPDDVQLVRAAEKLGRPPEDCEGRDGH